mmetsp:Transcript_32465/g.79115  ORF Transcript_32465/g.79115 Transcript_32465/m.79115 type:complete len:175 (-) Transcript_32465:201-725(-)|eukprot:CAMPEP_0113468676 /NCGR_PEP_ID=MMETSP0014_2-20120614/15485_1 /TAXON_ID=2857 /ORGANISM="Nitzschia sp." /LENGTH=174 /DNA_ID=CAMNT_0000361087 /DNA_START=168 /DNA_END=692 /DNA_ORIENTATION=- /assembly_acc=CAM_ASM_000159
MSDSADSNGLCIERQSIIAIPTRRASKDTSELSYDVQDDDLGLFDLIDEDAHWEGDAAVDESQEVRRRAPRRMSITASSSFNTKARSGGSVCSRSSMSSRSARSRASRLRATKSSDLDEMSTSLKSQMTISSGASTGCNDSIVSDSGSDGSRTPTMIKAKPIRKIAFPASSADA